jgi:hypothetical protein
MNFKKLFSRAASRDARSDADGQGPRREAVLDAADLDACVGGRQEVDGVGCYLRATNPRMT